MANLPVRDLGGIGIVTDLDAYNLPPNALSSGVNVRFDNGKITRAPAFRNVTEFTTFDPIHLAVLPATASGVETIVVTNQTLSSIKGVTGAGSSDLSPTVAPTGSSAYPTTDASLGNVLYLNNRGTAPLAKLPSSAIFEPLANWPSNARCQTLRSYRDTLVALNVTKGGVEYPAMVKWSEFAQYSQVPTTWDETDPENNAGENVLNNMSGPIVDGLAMRDSFIIYGEREVWSMDYIGGQFIYEFRKRFDTNGLIAANCVVEVDGIHYVFGRDDIYRHDGTQPQSIIHGKNKDFVFGSLIKDMATMFFVAHNPRLDEVMFCYVSEDGLTGFQRTDTGCNRAAVYNYRRGSWSFYDLPNVTSYCVAKLDTGITYETSDPATYETLGGTYLGTTGASDDNSLFSSVLNVSISLSASRLYAFDNFTGGQLNAPIETETVKDAFIERIGIDLDETGAPLRSYKSMLALYPQMGVDGEPDAAQFQFGATDIVGVSPAWDAYRPFDPTTQTKLDIRVAGRYLGYRLKVSGLSDFAFSGFDAKVTTRGLR